MRSKDRKIMVAMTGVHQTLREKLLADAKAFSARTGIAPETLAYRVVKNSHFFERLENGGDCVTGTYELFQAYFSSEGGAATPPSEAA